MMHWLDLSLLGLLALGAVLGFWSGFILQAARLLCLALSVYATILANERATHFLQEQMVPDGQPVVLHAVAYIGVFLVVYVALFALSRLLYRAVRATKLEFLDRVAGAVLGGFKVALILAPLCGFLAFLTLPMTDEWMKRSTIAPALAKGLQTALVAIPEHYKTDAREQIDRVRDRLHQEAAADIWDLGRIEAALKK